MFLDKLCEQAGREAEKWTDGDGRLNGGRPIRDVTRSFNSFQEYFLFKSR